MKRTLFIAMTLVLANLCAGTAFADGGAGMVPPRIYSDNSLIKSYLVVCDGETLRYSLLAASQHGVKFVEILSAGKIINHKECYGAESCMISGVTPGKELPSDIVTAQAVSADDIEQKEKMKVNFDTEITKVYFIGSVPGFTGMPAQVVAAADDSAPPAGGQAESSSETPAGAQDASETGKAEEKEISAPPRKGPVITVQVRRNSPNDFSVKILARDEKGIDFIEILENGSFLDVQICENREECTFVKNIKKRDPGRNRYLIKSMNSAGALSFQEELISFTE